MSAPAPIHLGFEIGTGEPVAVPVGHLAVVGQTQAAGKTTCLEALVARSGLPAIAFVTKRHEASFRGQHHSMPPYFRERADWQFVSAVLEATLRERMRFERSWIMRACKGAATLADVHRNVRRLMDRAKGLSADVYMVLDHYLDIVVPQIGRLDQHAPLTLGDGLNVSDISGFTTELQGLVIRSVLEWVYQHGDGVLTLLPESWEFLPQNRASPVLLACEQLIRKGGAGRNYVWIDSQDLAAVHKNVLRSVGIWILGVQREANEVRRTLAHIPGKKPKIDDVMGLALGQFIVCHGRTVVRAYVQPAWLDAATARRIALGEIATPTSPTPPSPPKQEGPSVNDAEATALREQNEQLKVRVRVLESELADMRATLTGQLPPPVPQPRGTVDLPIPRTAEARAEATEARQAGDLDALYAAIKDRALRDNDARVLAVLRRVPELEVTKQVERIRVDYATQPGAIAAMIAEGFFADDTKPAEVIGELKRRGRGVHAANVSRDLGRLTEQGFLTRENGGTYRAVPAMKVNIIEA